MSISSKITFTIDADHKRQLQQFAADLGVSVSELVAAMVDIVDWDDVRRLFPPKAKANG